MKNTIIFLGVVIAAILTWFAYALLASFITDTSFKDCLTDDTVITFLFFSGWILPSLVGYDLYKHVYSRNAGRKKKIDKELLEIKANAFTSGRRPIHTDLLAQLHLN